TMCQSAKHWRGEGVNPNGVFCVLVKRQGVETEQFNKGTFCRQWCKVIVDFFPAIRMITS
ncbi:hypothetical protein J6590_094174, partial [Homalodisca vitripennis]